MPKGPAWDASTGRSARPPETRRITLLELRIGPPQSTTNRGVAEIKARLSGRANSRARQQATATASSRNPPLILLLDQPHLVAQRRRDGVEGVQLAGPDPAPQDTIQGRLGAVRRRRYDPVRLARLADEPLKIDAAESRRSAPPIPRTNTPDQSESAGQ
jgi:hypothetical protein